MPKRERRPRARSLAITALEGATNHVWGVRPDPRRKRFDLALFLDEDVAHWVIPLRAPEGAKAFRLKGPTRSGKVERVTVTLDDRGHYCTCFYHFDCEHIRALRAIGLL